MNVSSINDHIKPPDDGALVEAYPDMNWFVISYTVTGGIEKVFYNQDGREVFRVRQPPLRKKTFWEEFWDFFFKE